MSYNSLTLTSDCPEATEKLAHRLGQVVGAGDVLLLEGDIGAGKTYFARSLIQSLLIIPEDIPSPTFTLIQMYEANDFEIWHSDLYRLSSPDEIVELGLTEAFHTALCLVEWPSRLGDLAPCSALTLKFETTLSEESRQLCLSWTDAKWDKRMKDIQGG